VTVIIKAGKSIEITAQASDREVGRAVLRYVLSLGGAHERNEDPQGTPDGIDHQLPRGRVPILR